MADKKDSKSKGKKIRFIFSRGMTEDQIIDAIKKLCKETGIKFVDDEKQKARAKTKAKKVKI